MDLNSTRRTDLFTAALLALLALCLTGCAFLAPATIPLGSSLDAVRQSGRKPSGEYALAGGGRRLEFAQGSFGRQTWMLDFDAGGSLVASQQVLTDAHLATIGPGLSREQLLMRFGHPAHIDIVGRQHLQVWNYRFADGDCEWYRVSVSDSGPVIDASRSIDAVCDVPNAPN